MASRKCLQSSYFKHTFDIVYVDIWKWQFLIWFKKKVIDNRHKRHDLNITVPSISKDSFLFVKWAKCQTILMSSECRTNASQPYQIDRIILAELFAIETWNRQFFFIQNFTRSIMNTNPIWNGRPLTQLLCTLYTWFIRDNFHLTWIGDKSQGTKMRCRMFAFWLGWKNHRHF